MPENLVLVNNVYSHQNPGDSAIVEAIGRYVLEVDPGARVYFLSQFWRENEDYYGALGIRSAPPLWDIPMDDNKVRRLGTSVLSMGALLGRLRETRRDQPAVAPTENEVSLEGIFRDAAGDTLPLYQDATLIIDAGGGSLFSSNRYRFYLGLYQHLFNLWIGKRLGKPVIAAPQSIGPLHRPHDLAAVRSVLGALDVVMIREPISARLVRSLGVPFHQVHDAAFLGNYLGAPSPAVDEKLVRRTGDGPNVGVTVLDWGWTMRAPGRSAPAMDAYLRKLAMALARLGAGRVHIYPHVTASHGDSDLDASIKLHHLLQLSGTEAVLHDMEGCSLSDRCHLYGQMDVFIGSRMHSCIIAMLQGVPTVGLAYQPKTRGVFQWLGLERFALDIRTFSVDQLHHLLGLVAADPVGQRDTFAAAAETARREVRLGFDQLIRPWLAGP